MKRTSTRLAALFVVVFAFSCQALAEIKLPALFADHAVLQRGMAVPVWGTVAPNQDVTVEVAGKSANAKADAQGNFMAKLPELEYGGNAVTMTITAGDEKLVLKDILIGDVWVASGQSNMAWTFKLLANNGKDEAKLKELTKDGDLPNVRLFTFHKTTLIEPTNNVRGQWEVCSPEALVNFSAVAF